MILGWYGWRLEHPDDWAPVLLSGDRRSGLCQVASPDGPRLSLRWQTGSLRDGLLDTYRAKLKRDAAKVKATFDWHEEGDRYRSRGDVCRRGRVVVGENRVAFVEIVGARDGELRGTGATLDSLSECENGDVWGLMGMAMRVPTGAKAGKRTLLSGRTELKLTYRAGELTLERWGLAETLLRDKGLTRWLADRADLPAPPPDALPRFDFPGNFLMPHRRWLARHNESANQIELMIASVRDRKLLPEDDWFVS